MFGENTDKGYKQKPIKQSTGHWKIRCTRRTSACHCHDSATLRQWCRVRQWWDRKWGINTVQEEDKIVLVHGCDGHSPKSKLIIWKWSEPLQWLGKVPRQRLSLSVYLRLYIMETERWDAEGRKDWLEPGVPKSDVMTVLGCPFASYIPDLEVKNPTTWKCHSTGVSCRLLLQGIFLTQESNLRLLCLLYWQADSLPLSHLGSPQTKTAPNELLVTAKGLERGILARQKTFRQ